MRQNQRWASYRQRDNAKNKQKNRRRVGKMWRAGRWPSDKQRRRGRATAQSFVAYLRRRSVSIASRARRRHRCGAADALASHRQRHRKQAGERTPYRVPASADIIRHGTARAANITAALGITQAASGAASRLHCARGLRSAISPAHETCRDGDAKRTQAADAAAVALADDSCCGARESRRYSWTRWRCCAAEHATCGFGAIRLASTASATNMRTQLRS